MLEAIANELWKAAFASSMLKRDGSPLSKFHTTSASPPEVKLVGVWMMNVEKAGTARANKVLEREQARHQHSFGKPHCGTPRPKRTFYSPELGEHCD